MPVHFNKDVEQPILFFDGVCNLCHHTVQFVLKYERVQELRFASLQSPLGQEVIAKLTSDLHQEVDSIVLWQNDQLFTRSTAALLIAKRLRRPWRFLAFFRVLPSWIRDPLYDIVARYRYAVFGRQDQCELPSAAQTERFI